MGVRVVALAGVLHAGCYSPQLERDCEVVCASGHCPSGLTCEAGFCRVPGFTGGCGSAMEDAQQIDDASVGVDTATPDLLCSYTCYAPSSTASQVGSAACQSTSNGCQGNMSWIDPIDLCSCSTGEPELYVRRFPMTFDVALVAPALAAAHSYAMTIDGGTCYGTGQVCPGSALAGCTVTSEVDGWLQLPMPAGPMATLRFFDDDGTGCTSAVKYTFVVPLSATP